MTAAITESERAQQIATSLDQDHIRSAAHFAGVQLRGAGHAVINLEPGDVTRYTIIVTAPGPSYSGWQNEVVDERHYLVACSFGPVYPWTGSRIDWSYVQSKWVSDGRTWTAVVIAEFLNALAEQIEENI